MCQIISSPQIQKPYEYHFKILNQLQDIVQI